MASIPDDITNAEVLQTYFCNATDGEKSYTCAADYRDAKYRRLKSRLRLTPPGRPPIKLASLISLFRKERPPVIEYKREGEKILSAILSYAFDEPINITSGSLEYSAQIKIEHAPYYLTHLKLANGRAAQSKEDYQGVLWRSIVGGRCQMPEGGTVSVPTLLQMLIGSQKREDFLELAREVFGGDFDLAYSKNEEE